MNRDFIIRHWYASVYEQFENQTNDVEFLLSVLKEQCGGKPQRILEMACGGGRIAVPLAKAGHDVTGFDRDPYMLERCYARMKGLPNLRCYQMEGGEEDWGSGYDVVVMAGNVLMNIEGEEDYKGAQRAFLRRAARALRPGGHLYLDFELHKDNEKVFPSLEPMYYFEGSDDYGTRGRTASYGGCYDPVTRLFVWAEHWELTANNGEEMICHVETGCQYLPAWEEVQEWLEEAGLTMTHGYHNFTAEAIPTPLREDTWRATVWAEKK